MSCLLGSAASGEGWGGQRRIGRPFGSHNGNLAGSSNGRTHVMYPIGGMWMQIRE